MLKSSAWDMFSIYIRSYLGCSTVCFFFQAEDGIRDVAVTGVQTCALPISLLLLTGGALFSRTLWNLRKQDLGLTTENLITFSIAPQLSGYDEARTVALVDQLRERLGALPGGLGVGSAQIAVLPGTGMGRHH